MTEIEAKAHYECNGYKENRKYLCEFIEKLLYSKYFKINNENLPLDFCWKAYVKCNSDLEGLNEEEATNHFLNYGKNENRMYTNIISYNEEITDDILCDNNENVEKIYIDNIDEYDNLILIIDYLYTYGGASTFLESIINKYKMSEHFLIAKSVNNLVSFSINNKYYLKENLNEMESINFLKISAPKICKIFINHTLGHSIDFINSIFNLNKSVAYITHDYLLVSKNPQPLYDELIIRNNVTDLKIINNCHLLISQNLCTLHNFLPFLQNDNIIKIVSPLPDYRKTITKIETNNSKIVVGIIGNISDIKGKNILKQIIKQFKNCLEFVVFGELNIPNFNNCYKYKTINDLNNLLMIHKPNVILETSIWPETYSYTLTLSKILGLPIIYLKKHFISVVEDRLKEYSKSYKFETINEFYNIVVNKTQNYFYTIDPTIYYSKFWDEYFITLKNDKMYETIEIKKDNFVLVTSKLVKAKTGFTYSKTRSVYSFDELFNQTVETLKTLRTYIPNAYIVLFDNSILDNEHAEQLKSLTDVFINITDNEILNYYTDSKYKLLGEMAQMCFFYFYYYKNICKKNNIKNFFKISGRYLLNEEFDFNNFDNNCNIIKRNSSLKHIEYYYTSFYKLNNKIVNKFFIDLINCFNNKHMYLMKNYEEVIPTIIEEKVNMTNLGVTQIFAPFFLIDKI